MPNDETAETSDARLLERWRNEDQRAGAQLFKRLGPRLIRFFRNRARGDVQDLVQETFLRLVRSRDDIREIASVRSYALGIAWRIWCEHLRDLERRRAIDPYVESPEGSDAEAKPMRQVRTPDQPSEHLSSIIRRKQQHRLLLQALTRLPVERQVELELHYFEGLKYKEIAECLGISVTMVGNRLQQARKLLEQMVRELEAAPALIDSTVEGLDAWMAGIGEQLAESDEHE